MTAESEAREKPLHKVGRLRLFLVIGICFAALVVLPNIPNITFGAANFYIKAGIHILIYGVITALLFLGLRCNRRAAVTALVLAALLAGLDEFFQHGSATRSASISDWLFDLVGIVIAMLLIAVIRRRKLGTLSLSLSLIALVLQTLILSLRPWSGIIGTVACVLPFTAITAGTGLLVAVGSRSLRHLVIAALPCVVLLAQYGQLIAAVMPSPAPPGRYLSVATINIEYMDDPPVPSESIRALADQLEKGSYDFVFLQEISKEAFAWLQERLVTQYPYSAISGRFFPKAILSRHAISDTADLAPSPWGPAILSCSVMVDSYPMKVMSVHLQPAPFLTLMNPMRLDELLRDSRYHKQDQIEKLVEVARSGIPIIAGGDYNLSPESADYGLLRKWLRDAHADGGTGIGFTWPCGKAYPRYARIDYIFTSADLEAFLTDNHDVLGSDHMMVASRIRIGGLR